MFRGLSVGVVVPALNEEQSVGTVVSGLLSQLDETGDQIADEIVVCDNGSSDRTAERAASAGAKVVKESVPGYGRACQRALQVIQESSPEVIVFTDADNAFDPHEIGNLLEQIHAGADLVIGSRTLGHAERGALSTSQRFGNQLATLLIRYLWGVRMTDLGPYRAIRARSLRNLQMRDEAYGWTVEMQVKAIQHRMTIREVPVRTNVRVGKSKISGTLKGVIGAGVGIISMIVTLWLKERISGSPTRIT